MKNLKRCSDRRQFGITALVSLHFYRPEKLSLTGGPRRAVAVFSRGKEPEGFRLFGQRAFKIKRIESLRPFALIRLSLKK
jgi:hypothetical protein